MKFQPKKPEEVDLNITPLIDVVFLLLIFFMVSTTFDHESEVNITLPKASKEIPRQNQTRSMLQLMLNHVFISTKKNY